MPCETERKSRLSLLAKVVRQRADAVTSAVITLLQSLDLPLHTLASDNKKEFLYHETIAQALKVCFFVHPYAAWERGLTDNTNGLIRQYFPKPGPFQTKT